VRVVPVACLSDNYAYLIAADGSREALVVDPSESAPVAAAVASKGLSLVAILNTHHHWDHVGGNEELCAGMSGLRVFGHASDAGRIPRQTDRLEDGARFELAGLSFRILHIPGHTLGAIAYVVGDDEAVFTGDTLFAAGCGRLFEGTPAMMNSSLNEKLAALPDRTLVYFGHEYTASNLRFAAWVEPDNAAIAEKAARVADLRARGEPTTPSTLGEERRTNPFLRVSEGAVIERVRGRIGGDESPATVLGAVRAEKDAFR
jgi:hydroxyacylglutathione hydrolase